MKVISFLQKNAPNISLPKIGKELADGADGQIFEFEDKIIKFSILQNWGPHDLSDQYQMVKSNIDFIIENKPDFYCKVFSHEFIIHINKIPECIIHYYVMEKLNKLSDDEKRVFHSILCHEDRNIKKSFNKEQLENILIGLSKGLDFDKEKVIAFYNGVQENKIQHLDLHVRNIMKDNNQYKLIDLDRLRINK